MTCGWDNCNDKAVLRVYAGSDAIPDVPGSVETFCRMDVCRRHCFDAILKLHATHVAIQGCYNTATWFVQSGDLPSIRVCNDHLRSVLDRVELECTISRLLVNACCQFVEVPE